MNWFRPPILVAVLAWGSGVMVGSQSRPEDPLSPLHLLTESRAAAGELPLLHRAFHLHRLVRAAHKTSPETAADWAEELFWLTLALPKTWNRGALQKNALAELSLHRPDRAWELLDLMDPPLEVEGVIPEDLRASVAETLFFVYWERDRSNKTIEALRLKATSLGTSGQYPYRAVVPILAELMASDTVQAAAWFDEMRSFYEKGRRIQSGDEEFAEVLLSFGPRLPRPIVRRALEAAIRGLQKAGPDRPGSVFIGEVETSAGIFTLRRRQEIPLIRLMPLLKELHPSLAKEVAEESPVLRAAYKEGLEVRSIREATVVAPRGSGGPPLAAAGEIAEAQRALEDLDRRIEGDPSRALEVAWRIKHPAVREEAFHMLLRSLDHASVEKAQAVLQAISGLDQSDRDADSRLNLLVLRARAAKSAGRLDVAWDSVEEAFELGESLLEKFVQLHPVASIQDAPAMAALSQLTRTATAMDPPRTVFRLRRSRNALFRAHLLAEAAEAMADGAK